MKLRLLFPGRHLQAWQKDPDQPPPALFTSPFLVGRLSPIQDTY